jgi:hypothetical protein
MGVLDQKREPPALNPAQGSLSYSDLFSEP